jgi:putative toxin-antitoxin system antitoxin component (TIGR02293 family)
LPELPGRIAPAATARALNYHDFGKARVETRENPGFRQPQAAGTGPIIRIAEACVRRKCVMLLPLAETAPRIKRLLRSRLSASRCICAICAYIEGQLAEVEVMAARKPGTKHEGGSPSWEQTDTPRGSFQEIEQLTGHRFPLPYTSIDALKERGFTNDELYSIVAPRRTLARRKERGEDLTATESDKVLRLQRISDMADRVFGNHEKAQRWLRSEIIALDGARPIDLLASETGANVVFEELIRIDYGMFA